MSCYLPSVFSSYSNSDGRVLKRVTSSHLSSPVIAIILQASKFFFSFSSRMYEEFLWFCQVPSIDSVTLKNKVMRDSLCSLKKAHGQCHDGASAMSGVSFGGTKLIMK